jgi:hypothetical protein
MAFNRMSAALSVLISRNFSKIFLRARRTLKFSHSLGQKRTNHRGPKSTVVRCCPKADKICGAANVCFVPRADITLAVRPKIEKPPIEAASEFQ